MVIFALTAPALPALAAAAANIRPVRPPFPGELPPDARIVRADLEEKPKAWTANDGAEARLPGRGSQLFLLIIALVPYATAMVMFARQGEDATVRWLWVAGIILFVLGQVVWPAARRLHGAGAEASPQWRWRHVAVLVVILAGAFWLRFNRLETIPDDFHGDMASMGLQAREFLASTNPTIFREGWANIPMVGFLPSAFGLAVFGDDLFGLNMSAVLAGMLTLIALYLLVWRLFDSHRLAALSTAMLAITTPHIHFSRLAAYMDPWPFMLFATFFLVDGMRGKKPQSFAIAGVLVGIGFQMYYSARVMVIILAVAFLYLLIVRRSWLTGILPGVALFVVGMFIGLGPSLLYFLEHREPFVERSRAVWLFYEPVMTHLKGKYGVDTPLAVLLEQTKRSLLMFNQTWDSSTQFGYMHGMFSSLISPLVVLGFGYSVRRWRHPGLGMNLIWLLIMLVNGSALTGDAPFWPRLVGIIPAAALLAALVLDRFWAVLRQPLSERLPRATDLLLGVGVLGFLIFAGWQNWTLYYDTVHNNARAQAFMGRYLYKMSPDIAACTFSDPYQLQVRETYFLAWPRQIVDLPADAPDGLMEMCPGPPFVWILTPTQLTRLPALQARWPDGEVAEHFYGGGAPAFTSYLVRAGKPSLANLATTPAATPSPGEKYRAHHHHCL